MWERMYQFLMISQCLGRTLLTVHSYKYTYLNRTVFAELTVEAGSSLVCQRKNNPDMYVQAGMFLPRSPRCGTTSVYVDVPHFVNWMYNTLKAQRISPYSQNYPGSKVAADIAVL